MGQIFNACKSLIEPQIGRAAKTLGESEEKVTKASQGILAGLLGRLASKGSNPTVEHALATRARADMLPHLATVFGPKGELEQEAIGYKLFHSLYAERSDDFVRVVGRDYALSNKSSYSLVTMISTAVSGFLGGKIQDGRYGLSSLAEELGKEKNVFAGLIPMLPSMPHAAPENGARATGPERNTDTPERRKGGMGWLCWLLAAIVLLLLLLFGLRSCKNRRAAALLDEAKAKTEQAAQAVKDAATTVATTAAATTAAALSAFTLPGGVKIDGPADGTEAKMIAFLNSDAYKNAKTDADLKGHWFEFRDVEFVRNSHTEFVDPVVAERHLSNVAAILKAWPDAKIRIAGNADRSGNRIHNAEISEKRAIFVDKLIEAKGIDPHRITTEGFGDEHASWSTDATATESATDRDIAFRFTK